MACSSVSSVRWASKLGRCKLATYSSGGNRQNVCDVIFLVKPQGGNNEQPFREAVKTN